MSRQQGGFNHSSLERRPTPPRRCLLKLGIDYTIVDSSGRTAWEEAKRADRFDILEMMEEEFGITE